MSRDSQREDAQNALRAPEKVEPQDCIECGEPINLRRLELFPRTRRCEDCASDEPKRGKW